MKKIESYKEEMKMKGLKNGFMAVIIMLGLVMIGSSPATAAMIFPSVGDTLTFKLDPMGGGTNGGGPFDADINKVNVNPFTVDFITFCLEKDETLSLNTPFMVASITTSAINGGVGGPSPDPLNERTAFLYQNFVMGTLDNYGFDYTDAADYVALQQAIWFIEEESNTSSWLVGIADAEVAIGGDWYGMGLGAVKVANLKWLNGTLAQDVLILPEPGMLMLFGSSLLGLAFFTRKK
jgi:hypothetical protein